MRNLHLHKSRKHSKFSTTKTSYECRVKNLINTLLTKTKN